MITTTSRPDTWATGPLRTNSTSSFSPTLVFSALTERTALYSPSFLFILGYLKSIQPWLLHIFVTAKCNESRAREEIRQWENGNQTPKQNSVLRGTLHPWTSAPTPEVAEHHTLNPTLDLVQEANHMITSLVCWKQLRFQLRLKLVFPNWIFLIMKQIHSPFYRNTDIFKIWELGYRSDELSNSSRNSVPRNHCCWSL